MNGYKLAKHALQPHISKKQPKENIQEGIVFLTTHEILIVWMLV